MGGNTHSEELLKVIELAMDIPTDLEKSCTRN